MTVWVVFEVKCSTVNFEDIRLVGSLSELGAWNPSQALQLKASERTYPLWRTAELSLPSRVPETVQYKYIKVFGGSVVQWEAGPTRILERSCLSEGTVNYVDDGNFGASDTSSRQNRARIRFQEGKASQLEELRLLNEQLAQSIATSRFASSVPSRVPSRSPSPLRTSPGSRSPGQTPPEKTPSCIEELERLLRELKELEPMNLQSRAEIRRAIAAVRSAVDVERSVQRLGLNQKRSLSATFAMLSLLVAPIMPIAVATALIISVPAARQRFDRLLKRVMEDAVVRRPLTRLMTTSFFSVPAGGAYLCVPRPAGSRGSRVQRRLGRSTGGR